MSEMIRKRVTPPKRNSQPLGASTYMSPELQNEMCGLFRAGNFAEDTCAFVGIGLSVFYRWMKRGRDEKDAGQMSTYVTFYEAVSKAQAEAKIRNVMVVNKGASTDPEMALRWLKARWPRDFDLKVQEGAATVVNIDQRQQSVIAVLGDPAAAELIHRAVEQLGTSRTEPRGVGASGDEREVAAS